MQGTRLGPYEIVEQLGAGGMGEVWLAQDTRLGRKVAVKILPEQFASDPERLARFEQEARASAALNHPHIAAVYDVGHEGGVHFMVQEYLQGHTLRTVLDESRMPLPAALRAAIEIGEGLVAAHAAGIVHRDLKPENVFVTPDGHAKILDFGLAKLTEIATAGPGSASLSPTVLGTVAGQIMGTAGYLAPEQIDGTGVDHRADVFSFGCVLYELTTGKRAFQGRNMIETLDRVANREPEELATIDDALPAELARILSKSLAKSPASRYQSAGDMVVDLRSLVGGVESGKAVSIANASASQAVAARPALALVAGAAAVALIAGALGGALGGAWLARPEPQPERLLHFEFDLPSNDGFSRAGRRVLAISPDGRRVAFTDEDELYLRSLDDTALVAVRGVRDPSSPNFSPDGEWVAFWSDGELRKIPIQGGSFVRLAAISHPYGMRWQRDGSILAAVAGDEGEGGRILRVDGDGGEPEILIQLEPDEHAQGPLLLPGNDWLLFSAKAANDGWDEGSIVAQSLSTGERRQLVDNAVEPRVVGARALTFLRDNSLFAVPFDADRVEVTGGAVPMLEGVSRAPTGGAYYDVSERGDLVFGSGGESAFDSRIAWFDREGRMELLPLEALPLEDAAPSPDGTRIAVTVESDASSRINIIEVARGALQTLAQGPSSDFRTPQWSRDGRWVYFTDTAGVYRARSDFSGGIETVAEGIPNARLGAFSSDGSTAALYAVNGTGGRTVYLLDAESGALEQAAEGVGNAELSPDGRLLAYTGWEQTFFRVYVLDLESGQRQVASSVAANDPAWSPDGGTLYLMNYPTQMIYAVDVTRDPQLAIGEQREVFRHPSPRNNEFVVAEGERFLTLVPANVETGDGTAPESYTRIHVITGWADEVARRVKPR